MKKLSSFEKFIFFLSLIFFSTLLLLLFKGKVYASTAKSNKIAGIIEPCTYCSGYTCVSSNSPSCDDSLNECTPGGGGCGSPPTATPRPTSPPGPGPGPQPTVAPTPVPEIGPVPPPYVPCNQTRDTEFHSLRPYQASPCNQNYEDLALFCGNDLVLSDSITVNRNQARYCQTIPDAGEICTFIIPRSKDIAIDLSGAELPIAGNTEDVVNSQNQPNPEDVDNAQKVNEYVSWYLNGVNGRAEYDPPDPNSAEGVHLLVDYSGPIKKLLPYFIKEVERDEETARARTDRHNQIVGCVSGGDPTKCYPGGAARYRLSNWITTLFPYVPFSSTEDRLGDVHTQSVSVQPTSADMIINNVSFTNQQPAELFFAHMQENSELANTLQGTYVPEGQQRSGGVSGVSPGPYCDLTRIRSNPGDNLFAGEISGTLNYTAQFTCAFDNPNNYNNPSSECENFYYPDRPVCAPESWNCSTYYASDPLGCPENFKCGIDCEPNPQCTVTANVRLSLVTETPLADDLWSRLVAGPSGTFKRFFPKVGVSPIEGILDIPAATGVIYRSLDGTPVYAGNPGTGRSGSQAELYFPHLGGVHEYFLKCIQQALRPGGYGEGCLSGTPGNLAISCDQNIPDSTIPSSWLALKDNFIRIANQWVPGQNRAEECYNAVVSSSLSEGVDPGLALWVWVHESGASNPSASPLDFGVLNASGFSDQLQGFLDRAQSYSASHYACSGSGVTNNLQAFAYIYCSGTCTASASCGGVGTAGDWWQQMQDQYNWISPSCPLPSSPTDTSCP